MLSHITANQDSVLVPLYREAMLWKICEAGCLVGSGGGSEGLGWVEVLSIIMRNTRIG